MELQREGQRKGRGRVEAGSEKGVRDMGRQRDRGKGRGKDKKRGWGRCRGRGRDRKIQVILVVDE